VALQGRKIIKRYIPGEFLSQEMSKSRSTMTGDGMDGMSAKARAVTDL
jgi:hypothetical protein